MSTIQTKMAREAIKACVYSQATTSETIRTLIEVIRHEYPGKTDTEILTILAEETDSAPIVTASIKVEKHLKKSGGSTPEAVLAFAKAKTTFSSKEAQNYFKVTAQKLAGSLAVLTKRGVIRKAPKMSEDETSLYNLTHP